MKSKTILWLLPAAVTPYLVVLAGYLVASNANVMDTVFGGNALWLLLAVVIAVLLALVFSIIGAVVALQKQHKAPPLAKAMMIVKIIQIPAYIAIYSVALMGMAIPIMLLPFTILAAMFDACFIAMTGAFGIVSAINAKKQGLCDTKWAVWTSVLSCIYCVDVVMAILFVRKLKQNIRCLEESVDEHP